jgi:hypothetical protein
MSGEEEQPAGGAMTAAFAGEDNLAESPIEETRDISDF